jgi:hypothetical protein
LLIVSNEISRDASPADSGTNEKYKLMMEHIDDMLRDIVEGEVCGH